MNYLLFGLASTLVAQSNRFNCGGERRKASKIKGGARVIVVYYNPETYARYFLQLTKIAFLTTYSLQDSTRL